MEELLKIPELKQDFEIIVADPVSIGILVGSLVVFYILLSKLIWTVDRENWYKESKIKAKKASGTATDQEINFYRSQKIKRWVLKLGTLAYCAAIPYLALDLIAIFHKYSPIVLDNWLFLLAAFLIYKVIKLLNAFINIELLAKKVESSRNEGSES
ncbi:MAG: hypothetical protein K6L73_14135 [Cellvibrionaceae bacterium]